MDNLPFLFKRHTSLYEGKEMLGSVELKIELSGETDIRFGITAITFLVDWGDGESDHAYCHHYMNAGVYRVRIVGTAIHHLDVSKCHLVELKLDKCFLLEHLQCAYNRLTILDIICCPELKFLDCSGNKLPVLRSRCNRQLVYLDCSDNELQGLEVDACPDLLYLYCFSNRLHHLYLGGCKRLVCVDVGNNRFEADGLYQLLVSLPTFKTKRKAAIKFEQPNHIESPSDMELLHAKGWMVV